MDKEVEEVIKRLQQETPDPLTEVMDDLVRDSEEPTSGTTHKK